MCMMVCRVPHFRLKIEIAQGVARSDPGFKAIELLGYWAIGLLGS